MPLTTVGAVMSACPQTIGVEQPLSIAHEMMRRGSIRHLPVLARGRVVGILSQHDLHLIETLRDIDPDQVPVSDAMSPSPYAVRPDTPIAVVAAHMAERRLGAAIVVDGERVTGVFTATDALRVLSQLAAREEDAGG